MSDKGGLTGVSRVFESSEETGVVVFLEDGSIVDALGKIPESFNALLWTFNSPSIESNFLVKLLFIASMEEPMLSIRSLV